LILLVPTRGIVPALGRKKIADVTRADVARLHHAGGDAPYQANRVLAVLSKMFNLAEAWGLRPDGWKQPMQTY